jgi:hypothetical protein
MAVLTLRELIGRVLRTGRTRTRKGHGEAQKDDRMAQEDSIPNQSDLPTLNGAAKLAQVKENGAAVTANGKLVSASAPESAEQEPKERMWRICEQVDAKVTALLAQDECETTKDLKGLQERVAESLKIIEDALERYQ